MRKKKVAFSCVWYSADKTRDSNSIQWNWNEKYFRVQQSPSYVNAMMHMSKERWVFSKISLKDDKNDCQKAKTHHTDPTFEFEVIHFHLGNSLKMDIFLLFSSKLTTLEEITLRIVESWWLELQLSAYIPHKKVETLQPICFKKKEKFKSRYSISTFILKRIVSNPTWKKKKKLQQILLQFCGLRVE